MARAALRASGVWLGDNADTDDDNDGVSDDEVDIERIRLAKLAEFLDPGTFRLLTRVGVEPGMHVLELGAGTGSVSAWLAERVGPGGRVMSTDIDLRFHASMPSNVIVRQHDASRDRLTGVEGIIIGDTSAWRRVEWVRHT